ncbi:hypothetical protein FEM08_36490 [Flavobacterium gilvum]|nr:hypothetical protein FEM08_36490 [Flavobacterium gilvum]
MKKEIAKTILLECIHFYFFLQKQTISLLVARISYFFRTLITNY